MQRKCSYLRHPFAADKMYEWGPKLFSVMMRYQALNKFLLSEIWQTVLLILSPVQEIIFCMIFWGWTVINRGERSFSDFLALLTCTRTFDHLITESYTVIGINIQTMMSRFKFSFLGLQTFPVLIYRGKKRIYIYINQQFIYYWSSYVFWSYWYLHFHIVRRIKISIIVVALISRLIIKITISSLVIGLKKSYFPLIHLPSCYRTVCYWIVCYWTVCYRTVQ